MTIDKHNSLLGLAAEPLRWDCGQMVFDSFK
jgi:hypothetical protein